MISKSKYFRGKVREDYLELVSRYPLTSIQSEEQLDSAQQILDQLLTGDKLSKGSLIYVDALSDLIATYEDQHEPAFDEAVSDGELLLHFMEVNGVSQAELHRQTKIPKSTISEILSGKKMFSKKLIGRLAAYFQIDKGILSQNL